MTRAFSLYNANLQVVSALTDAVGVLDHLSQLLWAAVPTLQPSHEAARTYAAQLNLFGYKWRLPTRAELLTLVDDTRIAPAIFTEAFLITPTDEGYWTSTETAADDLDGYWFVDFGAGACNYAPGTMRGYVRAVRV